jgi:protein SCO1/2
MIAAFSIALPASSNSRRALEDEFDHALLRVQEELYLGRTVPDVTVVTESGNSSLSALVSGQPTVLMLAYYTCGHACPLTIQNLARVLPTEGMPEHRVLVMSFDANDSLETLRHARSTLEHEPENWTFGLLSNESSALLTSSVGFKFFFSERDQIFVHPSVLIFLSPEGEVMRYLYGTSASARDIELALIESRNRAPRLNEFVDMVRLTCFQFDAARSRYVLHPAVIFGSVGIGILALTGLVTLAYKPTPKGG